MKVAVMFSGGKDSTYCLHEALKRGWEVVVLIAVKPKNTEAYLWHYATVEWTSLSSEALGIPLIMLRCDKIGPEEEAQELEGILDKIKVDVLLLGGIGLQKTQIRAIERVAEKFRVRVVLPHKGRDHYELVKNAIEEGFDIRITQVASYGLGPEWLGRRLDLDSLEQLKRLSEKCGFQVGFEGGSAETFVVDGPIFKKRIEFLDTAKVWDEGTSSGYLEVKDARLIPK
ncbi:MAG: diphthine--ammonia ligase [Candidatus Geothermarchaeales archaeon]